MCCSKTCEATRRSVDPPSKRLLLVRRMEKLHSSRKPTNRVAGRSDSINVVGNGPQHLPLTSSNALFPPHDAMKEASVPTSSSTFDALELLGPSLSEVLTFVNPPHPRRVEEMLQNAGEITDGGDAMDVGNQSCQSSDSSVMNTKAPVKFDLHLSRSAIIGQLVNSSIDNVRKTQDYLTTMLSTIQCEATGLVLLHDTTIVIFLETTAEHFVTILKQLRSQRIIETRSVKVLANCDDYGVRLLQGLYFKKIVTNRNDTGEWTDDAPQQCIIDIFLNLMKFIRKIGPMLPGEIRKCLTDLSNTDQTFLPSNDLVLWLLSREELMTLDEYLAFFDSPVAVELESERVWPVQPLINY